MVKVCWGVPAKVIEVRGQIATVDLGGVRRDVLVGFEGISPGQLVMIHAGIAIGSIGPEDFMSNIAVYRDLIEEELINSGVDATTAKEKANREMNTLLRAFGINKSIEDIPAEFGENE
ncbi:MAG: HypC/HybG/HupF family hydrogenase formation chaperone [Candidatus Hadarchaeum sp.]|uniref:HypC/HybG/HupF family hydrogenase formation chaperone n=1 Tax=Candidatus Hadarchaeum sp. TaxID=2883567 RepID=UPI003D0FE141